MSKKQTINVAKVGTGLFPIDEESENIIKNLSTDKDYLLSFQVDRNITMHRAYFSLLNFVWENLPEKFQNKCPKKHFYKLLKELQGRFELIEVSNKTSIKEYESLSFESMSQERFKEVFKEDVDFIISDILSALNMPEFAEILVMQYERTLLKYKL